MLKPFGKLLDLGLVGEHADFNGLGWHITLKRCQLRLDINGFNGLNGKGVLAGDGCNDRTGMPAEAGDGLQICLQPGTTDTRLSAPFQRHVPAAQLQTPAFTAQRLIAVMQRLQPDDSGLLYDFEGLRFEP